MKTKQNEMSVHKKTKWLQSAPESAGRLRRHQSMAAGEVPSQPRPGEQETRSYQPPPCASEDGAVGHTAPGQYNNSTVSPVVSAVPSLLEAAGAADTTSQLVTHLARHHSSHSSH